MDIGGNINIDFNGNRGPAANTTANLAWDLGDLHRFAWTTTSLYAASESTSAAHSEVSAADALVFDGLQHQQPLYAGDGFHFHPDPHLACLRLGKRHYFDERRAEGGCFNVGKRGKPYCGLGGAVGPVPRCQVEGCQAVLVNAKEYHKRHKVCEMHSKAPKVVVLGLEQRFCQQCSRFHVVSEFDESKRSCRRRLAGHNERRRKSSQPQDSISRNPSQEDRLMDERFQQSGRAHSLLSARAAAWAFPSDLSSRSSAALRELIAENREAALARQLLLERDSNCVAFQPRLSLHQHCHGHWDRFGQASAHVTLDLMQVASGSAFGELSVRGKAKEEEEGDQSGQQVQLWNSLEGNHYFLNRANSGNSWV